MTALRPLLSRLAGLWWRALPLLLLAWWLGAPLQAAAQNSCGPAAVQGAAPSDFRSYCWLDLAGFNQATATSTTGQTFSYRLPDGTQISFNLKVTVPTNGVLVAKAVPAWTGGAFGNNGFNQIPGTPVLYTQTAGTYTAVISNVTVTPPTGGFATYSLVIADGEQTNTNENLVFTTNGDPWVLMAQVPASGSTAYPALAYSNANRTATITSTTTGAQGAYVFRSDNNPTQLNVSMQAGGLQGFLIGARYASMSVNANFSGTGRVAGTDQFNYQVVTSNGTVLQTQTTTGTGTTNGNVNAAAVPTIAASYPFDVRVTAAGTTNLANYSFRLTCTNTNGASRTFLPSNLSTSDYTFSSLQFNDAITCTFTISPVVNSVQGTVYQDRNRNSTLDAGEPGPGTAPFFVKLVPRSGGSCPGPATVVGSPEANTGNFNFTNVTPGAYCVVLDDNASLTDVFPSLPQGWTGSQNASGSVVVTVPATTPPVTGINFGVLSSVTVSGTVFADTGVGGGTANNGVQEGGETGVSGLLVTASSGGAVVGTAQTQGDGSFTLTVPSTASNPVTIAVASGTGYVATGGSAGTSGGSYTRPSVQYTYVPGVNVTGLTFGLAPMPTFAANGAQAASPGTTVTYTHRYQAGTGGQVSFAVASATATWSAVLYRDPSCNGIDAGDAVQPTASETVTAGQQICLIAKQFVPANAALNASNTMTVTATFAYAGATPALGNTVLQLVDVTTVGQPNSLNLQKQVRNVTQAGPLGVTSTARPGETLEYTLTATNVGSQPLGSLVVNDATPAYTTYVSAACPSTSLPTGLTSCTLTTQPAVGAAGGVQWTFGGTLGSGSAVVVTYRVQIVP